MLRAGAYRSHKIIFTSFGPVFAELHAIFCRYLCFFCDKNEAKIRKSFLGQKYANIWGTLDFFIPNYSSAWALFRNLFFWSLWHFFKISFVHEKFALLLESRYKNVFAIIALPKQSGSRIYTIFMSLLEIQSIDHAKFSDSSKLRYLWRGCNFYMHYWLDL